MKKRIAAAIVVLVFCALVSNSLQAQDVNYHKLKTVQELIEQKYFRFKALYVENQGGSNEGYLHDKSMLAINNNLLTCYLPTYAGIDFTSSNFGYDIKTTKKNRYRITINPTDQKEADQLILNVSKDGYATLQVLHPNGSSINFRGIIMQG